MIAYRVYEWKTQKNDASILKMQEQYCEQIKSRQKTKRHQNRNQNGSATYSSAMSKHRD